MQKPNVPAVAQGTEFTLEAKNIIKSANEEATKAGQKEIMLADLFIAILNSRKQKVATGMILENFLAKENLLSLIHYVPPIRWLVLREIRNNLIREERKTGLKSN